MQDVFAVYNYIFHVKRKFRRTLKMSLKSDSVIDRVFARLQKIDPSKREVTNVFKFKITQGGTVKKTWMLDLKNVKLYEGDDAADCTLTCEDDVFVDMINKKLTPKTAVEQDKLDIDGEVALAMKLVPYISEL